MNVMMMQIYKIQENVSFENKNILDLWSRIEKVIVFVFPFLLLSNNLTGL